MGARTALSPDENSEHVGKNENTVQKVTDIPENNPEKNAFAEKGSAETEALFTPSFVSSPLAEKKAETVTPLSLQPEKKRFVPPVFAEKQEDSAKNTPSVSEPAKKQETIKDIKNSYLQKIKEAQKAQAESRQQEFNPQPPEKIIPVDAVNIIHAPLEDFARDFGEEQIDYSDEEERFAASAGNEGTGMDTALHLFDENTIPESEREALDWQAFLTYCEEHDFPVEHITRLQGVKVVLTKENCYIKISDFQARTFNNVKEQLESLLCTFLGRTVKMQVTIVAYELVSDEKLREKASNKPQIKLLMKEFGAEIYKCYDIKQDKKH